jgi:hypothetical protein
VPEVVVVPKTVEEPKTVEAHKIVPHKIVGAPSKVKQPPKMDVTREIVVTRKVGTRRRVGVHEPAATVEEQKVPEQLKPTGAALPLPQRAEKALGRWKKHEVTTESLRSLSAEVTQATTKATDGGRIRLRRQLTSLGQRLQAALDPLPSHPPKKHTAKHQPAKHQSLKHANPKHELAEGPTAKTGPPHAVPAAHHHPAAKPKHRGVAPPKVRAVHAKSARH